MDENEGGNPNDTGNDTSEAEPMVSPLEIDGVDISLLNVDMSILENYAKKVDSAKKLVKEDVITEEATKEESDKIEQKEEVIKDFLEFHKALSPAIDFIFNSLNPILKGQGVTEIQKEEVIRVESAVFELMNKEIRRNFQKLEQNVKKAINWSKYLKLLFVMASIFIPRLIELNAIKKREKEE